MPSRLSSPPRRWVTGARRCFVLAAWALVALPGAAAARSSSEWNPEQLASRVTAFRLENGLRFVVLERHDSPVFSFRTHVDAGSVDEQAGQTGLAHMFEHMAFKGTTEIGTRDYGKEQKAIDK